MPRGRVDRNTTSRDMDLVDNMMISRNDDTNIHGMICQG